MTTGRGLDFQLVPSAVAEHALERLQVRKRRFCYPWNFNLRSGFHYLPVAVRSADQYLRASEQKKKIST